MALGEGKTATLNDVPAKAVELEEYVAALFQASRHFVEKQVSSSNSIAAAHVGVRSESLCGLGAPRWRRSERDVPGAAVVNGERRSFALPRPISDTSAHERVRELVLDAYAASESASVESA